METVFACFSAVEVDFMRCECGDVIESFESNVCVFSTLEKARLSLEEHLNSMNTENKIEVKLIPRIDDKQWDVVNEWKFEELDEEGDPTTGEIWIIREMEVDILD